ncbi:NADPH-dependent aldehyde reductase ARI1-like isoform X1 [Brachionus plicatilis]|uniref:NADPH-dependent aldehyde reductase ARI1-like isoform X1 n=1 Tax=Brachionus plicatilis TaxID=10195 RepID=A0A3M7PPS1_BRAPC|nr:NADPH-dependent aldehyde reductase ARI1-like isoform X1 [Brachionus plicatilis]
MNANAFEITDKDLILVTGASGYIATHIVKQLLELGFRVRGTVRSLKDDKKVLPLKTLISNPKHELELCEADLLNEESWPAAVKDCTYVLHTASPFPNKVPKDENEIISPAVSGTLSVLKACIQTDSKVKKVVLTSSVVAVAGDNLKHLYTYTENDWPDLKDQQAYTKSKIMAEKAAWDFMKENNPNFVLTTINPGYVMGPLLHNVPCTSIEVVRTLLMRETPILADILIPACDVRNVAQAHINAMMNPEADSQRHIIVSTVENTSMKDWALILDQEFSSKGYNVPTKVAPNFMIKFMSLFDAQINSMKKMLGIKSSFSNSRMINVLKVEPIALKSTIIDMAYSLIEKGIIAKKF